MPLQHPVFSSENASAESINDTRWGARSGTEADKDVLNEIIKAELMKTGNHGDYFDFTETV